MLGSQRRHGRRRGAGGIMTRCSFPWTGLRDEEIRQKAPVPVLALRNELEHLREVILDPDTMTPAVAHDHAGENSGRIWWPSPNLIASASLSSNTVNTYSSE